MDGVGADAGFFDGREQVVAALLAEALELPDRFGVAVEPENVGEAVDEAGGDEVAQAFGGQTVDVRTAFADEALELFQVFGRALRVGALKRTGSAGADRHADGALAGRAAFGERVLPGGADDADDLGDDLVGLDDLDLRVPVFPDAEAVHLAEIDERRAGHGGALELDGVEDGDGRDGRGAARPLHMAQRCARALVLPLEGEARAGRVVAGDAAGGGVRGVVVADDQTVHGQEHFPALDPARPALHELRQVLRVGLLPLHRGEAEPVQQIHARAPGGEGLVRVNEREGVEDDVPLPHLVQTLRVQRERARGKVAGIGEFLRGVGDRRVELLKFRIGDRGLAADDQMPAVPDLKREAPESLLHEGDVGPDGAVAAGEDLCEPPAVVAQHQRQPVQLPAQPHGALAGPVLQLGDLFGLGQRQGGELVRLLRPGDVVLRRGVDLLRGAVRQDDAGLCLQTGQLVEQRVPFVVGHDLVPAAVVGLGRLVQTPDHLLHSVSLKLRHISRSRLHALSAARLLPMRIKALYPLSPKTSTGSRAPGELPCGRGFSPPSRTAIDERGAGEYNNAGIRPGKGCRPAECLSNACKKDKALFMKDGVFHEESMAVPRRDRSARLTRRT